MSQPPDDHLKALWQGQDTETPTMTVKAMRLLVRNDRDHVRQGLLLGFGLIVFEAIAFGSMLRVARNDVMRAGEIIILAGLAWMAWRLWRRRPGRAPDPDATTQSLVAFHRESLVRRRGGYAWLMISAGPMLVGVLVLVYGERLASPGVSASRLIPFFTLFVLWFVVAWFINRRGSRRLQDQIDEMDDLSRGG
jgi:hypothetical protein